MPEKYLNQNLALQSFSKVKVPQPTKLPTTTRTMSAKRKKKGKSKPAEVKKTKLAENLAHRVQEAVICDMNVRVTQKQ